MYSTGINQMSHSHLMYSTHSLIIGMRNDAENKGMINCYKTINRIIYNFLKACRHEKVLVKKSF
jgi:hypothetical protein